MASKNLTYNIFGHDRSASKAMDRVGSKAAKVAKNIAKSAIAIGVVMTAVVAKFAISSVKAAAEAEVAQNKLVAAWAKFPKTADLSVSALQDYNTQLAKTTRYDDDVIASGQELLARFNLTGQQIKKVTPLMLDYAAATGKTVPQAATIIGKALLGNAKALKAVGIDFKGTGDAGKDFASIFDLLSDKVGGFAEKDAQTASGKLEILKNRFGEFQETIGAALIGPLTVLADFIDSTVMPKLEEFGAWFSEKAPTAFENLGPALEDIAAKFSELGAAFSDPEVRDALFDLVTKGLPVLVDLLIALAPLIPPLASLLLTVFVPAADSLAKSISLLNSGFDVLNGKKPFFALLDDILATKGPIGDGVRAIMSVFLTVGNTIIGACNVIIGGIEGVINALSTFTGMHIKLPRISQVVGYSPGGSKTSSGAMPGVRGQSGPAPKRAGAFASGGIVPARPGGWLATVGEGGQDEAIIPLSKLGSGVGGGVTIINNIRGSVISERELGKVTRQSVINGRKSGSVLAGGFA